jgi:NTE family protein
MSWGTSKTRTPSSLGIGASHGEASTSENPCCHCASKSSSQRGHSSAFPSVRVDDQYLIDGAIGSNTAILTAAKLGATRIIVLPTGFACDLQEPPKGATARALHAITLLISNQIVRDLKELAGKVDVLVVPSLCPLNVSPYDFSRADHLIKRAADTTRKWLDSDGLSRPDIPNSLLPHSH